MKTSSVVYPCPVIKLTRKTNSPLVSEPVYDKPASLNIKKIISFFLFSVVLFLNGFTQTHLCSEYEADQRAEQKNPDAVKAKAELETFTEQFIQNPQKSEVTYIIPVVFHVLHFYGSENISKAQILDAVRILNNDYKKLNADTVNIIPEFQGIAANVHIEFRLAQIDPYGNCTDGIVRTVTNETYNANDDSKLLSPAWPRNKYLNVWTAANLESGAAGYSFYPSSVAGSWGVNIDGVMILATYVGSIETGSPGTSRALTHEVGHYLNLPHTWGNSNQPGLASNCSIDDGVSDTPNTIGHTSCNLYANTCGQLDNVQNYMEYSYCSNMYTEGQKARMRAALNSSVSGRNNLWTASNLIATGTNDGYIAQICIPFPDFSYNKSFGCDNLTVQYSNQTWNVDTGYTLQWSFPGGSPSVSNDTNPMVSYSAPGIYSASLTVSNISGTNQITKTQIIEVQNASLGEGIPWAEGFENQTFPVNSSDTILNWLVNGYSNSLWERTESAFYSGLASAMVNNDLNTSGQLSNLISPNIVLGSDPGKFLTFRVSYAQKDVNSDDRLVVYVSYNCGQTWYLRYNKSGSTLSTNGGNYTSSWYPDTSQWRKESFSISMFLSHPNLRFKFETRSGGGNKIYLDDINIDLLTGVEKLPLSVSNNLNIYPNPVNNESVLVFDLNKSSEVELSLANILGQKLAFYKKDFLSGPHDLPINEIVKSEISSGIYFLSVAIDGKHETLKLIKE